ncbi:MAG: gliding motility-associated C-terminal domain-containing protein [Saprospiraceae bacterium]
MLRSSFCLLFGILGFAIGLSGQALLYVVNSPNDVNDGVCDGVHCSLREAILASEADNRESLITFNIPGAGPYTINPSGTFPTINGDSTSIIASRTPGSEIIIDFGYRVFGGLTFLQINGNNTTIKGIHFTKMNYVDNNDHILRVGNIAKNSREMLIDSCSFYYDATPPVGGIDNRSIDVVLASNLKINFSAFGTDLVKSGVFLTNGSIFVEASQDTNSFTVSNCVFVTKKDAILARGGNGLIQKNIFGAYDTTKSLNFLDPNYAVLLEGGSKYLVDNNFFIGQLINGIFTSDIIGLTEITNNRFYNGNTDIELTKNSNATFGIHNNYGRNGLSFIRCSMAGGYSLNLDDNNISQYDNFYRNDLDPAISLASYNRNSMFCIANQVTFLDNTKSAKPNTPTIISVNRNQIIGTGDPNMFIAVYANPNTGCVKANTNCQGGFLIGITQANGLGSWILNANYPNKHSISAYQYKLGTGYNIYSEFSPCYRCSNTVKEVNQFDLCSSGSFTFRGKNYGAANPYDSIVVIGDGVSICDSVFIVNLNIKNSTREVRNLNICFNQSINIGGKIISKANPIDSLKLLSTVGCDSTIVLVGTERGLSTFISTICSNASVTIGGQVFDKNNTTGQVVLAGQSAFGCDSIIDVNLTVKNFAENNIVRLLCPDDFIIVGNKRYDKNNPKGTENFPMGSSTGCDSVVNVDLSFTNPISNKSITLCSGDSILIPGTNKFLSSNKPFDTLFLAGGSFLGCDSSVLYLINTIPNSIGAYTVSICRTDTLKIGGQIFHSGKTKGSFQIVNGASNGCDSTINVEVFPRGDAIGQLDTVSCEGSFVDIWGTMFTESNPSATLKKFGISQFGCDSFLMVNVNFIPKKAGNTNPTICRNGSITIGGKVFSAASPTGNVTIARNAAQGCDSIVTVNVNIAPSISAIYSSKDLLCNQVNTGTLTLENVSASGSIMISIDGKAPVNYSQNQLFSGLGLGVHSIRIIDGFNCDTTLNFNIAASAILSLQLPQDTTIFKGSSVLINAILNFVPSKITWDPQLYLSCTDCTNPTSAPDEDITYMLIVEDENGCAVNDKMSIRVKVEEADIYMPNVFSPNGDNLNDVVVPEFRFPDRSRIKVYRVFDRWGGMVYERLEGGFSEKFGWDGKFNGRDLNPGVYTYAILFETKDQEARWKTGDITLMR